MTWPSCSVDLEPAVFSKQGRGKQVKALTLRCDQLMAALRICDKRSHYWGPPSLGCSAHPGVLHPKGEEVPKVELPRGNQAGDKRCGQVMRCNSSSSEIVYSFLTWKRQYFSLPAQGQWEIEDLAQSMCVLLHPTHTREARNLFHNYVYRSLEGYLPIDIK